LGKLCLTDPQLANRCAVAFVKELQSSPYPIVRNNIMVVLCDLAKRYTSLIDRYVVDMAACLKDENELVRRQTLMMLTHLMQEDYIKWNTSGTSLLFYR
jgi:condensin-2 complex subunit D3